MKSDSLTKMVVHNKSLLFKKVRDNILFFVLSKGVAFLAPIFFLNFVSLEEYGVVEFSYALGSVLAVVAMLGLGGAYPYFVLRRGERDKKQVFMVYGAPVLGIAVIACLLRWYGAIGQRFSRILLLTLIFALQRLYSSILKSEDKGWLGVLFDGGYYFILTGVILIIWSVGITHHVMLLEAAMQVYLFVLGGFYVRQFYKLHTKSILALLHDDCGEILRYSLHMVVSGIIIYWLTSSARIYIAYFMGYEQVGIYSFYFRLAGIAIIIHQFLYIAFFQKLYMGNSRRLDLYYTAIMGLVLCGCLACYLFVPLLSRYFLKGLSIDNARLFFLIALQMPLWVGISLCEGLVGRENQIRQMNLRVIVPVMLLPVALYLLQGRLTIELFTLLNAVTFTIALAIQHRLLSRRGIKLRKCSILSLALFAASIVIYFTV